MGGTKTLNGAIGMDLDGAATGAAGVGKSTNQAPGLICTKRYTFQIKLCCGVNMFAKRLRR